MPSQDPSPTNEACKDGDANGHHCLISRVLHVLPAQALRRTAGHIVKDLHYAAVQHSGGVNTLSVMLLQ